MKFKSYLTLKAPIVIQIFKSTLDKMETAGIDINSLRKELSSNRELLVSEGTYNSNETFYIFTNQAKLLLKLDSKSGYFTVIGFYPNEFSTRSAALKKTAILRVSENANIVVPNYPVKDSFFFKGELVDYSNVIGKAKALAKSENASKILLDNIKAFANDRAHLYEKQKKITDKNKPVISKELEEMLDQTREIIDAYEEFDKAKAIDSEKVFYREIFPSNNKTGDKPHYVLETGKVDYSDYSVNTPIKLNDKYGNYLVASIVNYLKQDNDNGSNLVEIMFQEQVDYSALNVNGGFFTTFPTSVISNAQRRAVDDIRSGRTKAKFIDKAIAQGKPEKYKMVSLDSIKSENERKSRKLNDSQVLAVSNGIDSKDIYLVMGPPGTGKTSVIVEWVKHFTKNGMKVLVSSQNNAAVDNVLEKLTEDNNINILRMGKDHKISSNVLTYTLPEKLRRLRANIENSADRTVAKLENLECEVNKLVTNLKDIDKAYQSLIPIENRFRATVESSLLPLTDMLKRKVDSYEQVQLQLDRLQEKINRIYQKLNQSKKVGVLNWLVNLLTEDTGKEKLENLYEQVSESELEETRLVNEINNLQNQLETIVRRLENQHSAISEFKNRIHGITVNLLNSIDLKNDFNLFENTELLLSQNIVQRNDYIDSELNRLESLKTVYKSWSEDIKKEQNYGLNSIVLESANVVGSTCIGINSQYEFRDLDFDVSIIDEAGQIQAQNALIPINASNKLIMLGDYNQIPPVVEKELKDSFILNNLNTKLLDNSLFEIIYKKISPENKTMLDIQYRMPSSIANTISEFFYEGKYKSSVQKQKASNSSIIPIFKKPYVFIDTSDSNTRFENGYNLKGFENKYETDIICNLVGEILNFGLIQPEEIGIISAYKEQINTIRRELNKRNIITDKDQLELMVNTLDSFQGQERDVILYSFVRSNRRAKPTDKRIGFLKETRRLNVAMSRAKETLILIGDAHYLINCRYQEHDQDGRVIPETDEQPFSRLVSKILYDVNRNGTYIESKRIQNERAAIKQ